MGLIARYGIYVAIGGFVGSSGLALTSWQIWAWAIFFVIMLQVNKNEFAQRVITSFQYEFLYSMLSKTKETRLKELEEE